MDLKPKSHISISSTDSNKNTFNYYKKKGKIENKKNESINSNVEKELIAHFEGDIFEAELI